MADKFDPAHAHKLEGPDRLEALPQATVVDLLQLTGAETVVDYGAGTGIYTVAIADALPDGKVFAVEALPRLVELLREKITPEREKRMCICETGDNVVPLDDGEADRVVMVDVLHHLHDQPDALEEVSECSSRAACSWSSTGETQRGPFGTAARARARPGGSPRHHRRDGPRRGRDARTR